MKTNKRYCIGQGVPGSLEFQPAPSPDKHPSVMVRVRVTDPQRMDVPTGQQYTIFGSLHPNAKKYTTLMLRRLGVTDDGLASGSGDGIGNTLVTLQVYDEEYNGEVKERVNVFEIKEKRTLSTDEQKEAQLSLASLIAEAPPIEIGEHNFADPEALPERAFAEEKPTPTESSPF